MTAAVTTPTLKHRIRRGKTPATPAPAVWFEVEAKPLNAALKVLAKGIGPSRQPALGAAWIRTERGRIRMTVTNLDQRIDIDVLGKAGHAGQAAVNLAALTQATRTARGTVNLTLADTAIGVRTDRGFFLVPTLPIDEWPTEALTVDEPGIPFALDLDAVRDVVDAASDDEARPYLCTVAVAGHTYTATDSYRLHTVTVPGDSPGCPPLLLPAKALRSLLAAADGATTLVAHAHAHGALTVVRAGWDGATVTMLCTESKTPYPNWRKLIPETTQPLADFDVADLAGAVRHLLPFTKGALHNVPIQLHRDKRGIRATVESGSGDLVAEVVIPGSLHVERVAYNGAYLLATLKGVGTGRLVADSTKDPATSPAVLTEPFGDGGTRTRLLMPVRI